MPVRENLYKEEQELLCLLVTGGGGTRKSKGRDDRGNERGGRHHITKGRTLSS